MRASSVSVSDIWARSGGFPRKAQGDLYVGRVDFRDVFENEKWVSFRYELRGRGALTNGKPGYCPRGNDTSDRHRTKWYQALLRSKTLT